MCYSCPSWGKCAFMLTALLSKALRTLCIHLKDECIHLKVSGRQTSSRWECKQNQCLKTGPESEL